MDGGGSRLGGRWVRVGIVVLLVAAYAAAGLYFRLALRLGIVYTHLAYIPIVVACMWWGRRGIIVAGLVATLSCCLHALHVADGTLWADAARAALFLAAAVVVGELSERVRASEAALRESEEKYRWQIEESFAGIFAYRDERVLFANARFGAMLGYRPDELVGQPVWGLVHDDDRPGAREQARQRAAAGGPELHHECRFVAKDGSVVWTDLASSATIFQGKPAVLVNTFAITDRKLAEQKQRELAELARRQEEQLVHSTRLAELGEMAAAIAHELNQPLTGIRNFARNALYMLDHKPGSEAEVQENLRLISAQVDRAARIIGQMRELARKSDRKLVAVDINAIVRDSAEFLMPQLQLSGVELELDLAGALPKVRGDSVRLEQVVLNLLANARQAMEESEERRLTVRTRHDGADERPVVIEVADTGKGFSPAEAQRLFTPFYTTKKAQRGTGLGLSISLSIVTGHRGTLEAHGAPGKGARFVVRLPASGAEGDEGGGDAG